MDWQITNKTSEGNLMLLVQALERGTSYLNDVRLSCLMLLSYLYQHFVVSKFIYCQFYWLSPLYSIFTCLLACLLVGFSFVYSSYSINNCNKLLIERYYIHYSLNVFSIILIGLNRIGLDRTNLYYFGLDWWWMVWLFECYCLNGSNNDGLCVHLLFCLIVYVFMGISSCFTVYWSL